MSFTVKSFDDLVADMVAYIVANSSQITDLNPGSVLRSFCEGAGLCFEELYVSVYLGFKRYLNNIQETVFSYNRLAGVKATGNVDFTRSAGDNQIVRGDCEETTSPMITGETTPVLSNATWARDSAQAYQGTYSYKFTKTIASGTAAYADFVDNELTTDLHGLIPDKEYSLFARIYVPSGAILGSEVSLQIHDYLGGWQVTSQACALTYDAFQLVEVTRTIRTGATGAILRVSADSAAALDELFYVDDIWLVQGDITIPIGTRVKTETDLRFLTTAVGTLGLTTGDVAVEAEEVGVAYNVAANSIVVLEDDISGAESVTNGSVASGGVDVETDYVYKSRFQAYIEGLGKANIAGLIEGALSVTGITSASVVELIPPVSNVNAKLYIDDGSAAGVSASKVTEVQAAIDGDGTESSPGYRAAGVNVEVTKPGVVTQDATLSVTAVTGVDAEQLEIDVETALTDYVNTLGVGDDIIYNELVAAVMGVFGVEDCTFTAPTSNVSVSATQVGRLGTVTVTVT
jgi:uncharacterized phage protein gp47/JayE